MYVCITSGNLFRNHYLLYVPNLKIVQVGHITKLQLFDSKSINHI